ncbi:MAG TPA: site-specific integrase [Steroidobacteraceae bacterium]|jgi:site-specific recombinase XerD|nr:site-specific integrase [Steroidobacteraceae bacterium]
MDQSNPEVPTSLPLDRLVARVSGELEKLRYSRRSLRRYRTVWRHLLAFSAQLDLGGEYSEELAARFSDAYRMREGERLEPSERWRRHVIFGVTMLGTFAREGRIERCRIDTRSILVPALMKKPLREYEQYCTDRRHLRPSTLHVRMHEIAVFADFLRSRNVTTLDQMQPADVAAFVTSRHRLKRNTVSRIVSDVRSFLQFLVLRGILRQDLSQVLPKIRVPRDAAIPSVWDPELVASLLKVVDRSSPRGKRDYAILLLAYRLGLRSGDIRALTLDDLNWEAATIEITQSKTLAPLCLPLTEEVGEALIDYLKCGRPYTSRREVFLKLRQPFVPFSENNHLYNIITYWRELAGIHFRTDQRHGLHSLRHTLATQLLREQTPFHVISEILGHASTTSTLIYAKADVEALRGAALDPEEVRHVE